MLKPSTAVAINRSRVGVLAHGLTLLAIVFYAAVFSSFWLASVWLILGTAYITLLWRATPKRHWLRYRREAGQRQWERSRDGRDWRSVRCESVRLGPWLSGVRLNGKAQWLYPGCISRDDLRRLRETLLAHRE